MKQTGSGSEEDVVKSSMFFQWAEKHVCKIIKYSPKLVMFGA